MILDCEPLHDLKGHFENLFKELLPLLSPDVASACTEVLDATVHKEKAKGSDYRLAAVLLLICLLEHSVEGNALIVMQTIVEISEIMYSNDHKRSPRQILRLFNLTWLHGEVCADTFSNPSLITRRKMFGIYFHAITSHAAPQYETVCLKSTNAEDEERLFGQADSITGNTSNRHPNHVIPNLLLRMQAQANKQTRYSVSEQQSKISKAASQLPMHVNTCITKSLVKKKLYRWQAHLLRIATFLQPGPGVWWREYDDRYEFLDGPSEEGCRPQGPPLTHFRNHSLEGLWQQKKGVWDQMMTEGVALPTLTLRRYDKHGNRKQEMFSQAPESSPQTNLSPPTCSSHTSDHITMANTQCASEDRVEEWDSPNLPSVLADTVELDGSSSTNEALSMELPQESNSKRPKLQSDTFLKTTWAKRVSEVIGTSDKLLQFDELRAKAKAAKKNLPTGTRGMVNMLNKHEHLLTEIQSQLLAKHTELSQQIQQYELQHLQRENMSLPDINSDPYYTNLVHTRNLAKKLLKAWGINFQ